MVRVLLQDGFKQKCSRTRFDIHSLGYVLCSEEYVIFLFIVSLSHTNRNTPTGTDAASLRVPFRLTNDEDKTFGPRLLLEGSLLSSITPLGLVMMPRKKYGYNTDVLLMLINLAFLARKQHGLYEDIGYDVNQVLDQEKFVKSLATSLRYQLCLIPESFQISMMNTTQQFLIMDKRREMEFQTHKRRHGGSRWMFKTYDLSMSSWLFDLTTVDSKDIVIDEPTFTYSLTRRGGVRNDEYFRVVTLCEVVDSPSIEAIDDGDDDDDTIESFLVPPELYMDRMLFIYKGDYFEDGVDETSTESLEFRKQCLSSLESRAI